MIVAKAVIPNQYWILREDDVKVGNIEADGDGFAVKIRNSVSKFKNIKTIRQKANIDFEPDAKLQPQSIKKEVHGFQTSGLAYNPIFDVKRQLPLWTKKPKSKSWYAAGWYRVKTHRQWKAVFCPKLIALQRYSYQGPFESEEIAKT